MTKAMDDWAKMPLGRVITDEEMHRRTHPAWPYNYFNPGQPVDPAKVDELLKGGIDNKTLDSLKKNKNITMVTLEKLCRIIGCTPNDVIRFSDEPR